MVGMKSNESLLRELQSKGYGGGGVKQQFSVNSDRDSPRSSEYYKVLTMSSSQFHANHRPEIDAHNARVMTKYRANNQDRDSATLNGMDAKAAKEAENMMHNGYVKNKQGTWVKGP